MTHVRKSLERGQTQLDWLDSRHSFSFGDYYDPEHMGFGSLRVMNDDRIAPGGGFGLHPHRDMEILTFVLEGALEHRDNLGHREILKAGEVQRMTAGTGIWHSEHNASRTDPVHLYQVWLLPREKGLPPSYEQRMLPQGNGLHKAAAAAETSGAMRIQQDAEIHVARLDAGSAVSLPLRLSRKAWVQVMQGRVRLQGQVLDAGDGAFLTEEDALSLASLSRSQTLIFDLA